MAVLKLTGRLGLIEAGDKVFEVIDLKEQWAAAAAQEIMRTLVWYEEILKKQRFYLQISGFGTFNTYSGIQTWPLDTGGDDLDDPHRVYP
jgi:hypothetical protein